MPLYDFECQHCGHVREILAPMDKQTAECPDCGAPAHRIISSRSAYRDEADWVASCTVGFDPADTRAEVRAYLANPSDRQALARAMRAAGIRHKDHGEDVAAKLDRMQSVSAAQAAIRQETIERFKARHGL